jgi:glucose-6-phosphate 1-dehydrogenase
MQLGMVGLGRMGANMARRLLGAGHFVKMVHNGTYAALRLEVDSWRWAGVPFYVRTGKRLARRCTEIVVQFRRPPLMLFQQSGVGEIEPNRLHIHIQPDEARPSAADELPSRDGRRRLVG